MLESCCEGTGAGPGKEVKVFLACDRSAAGLGFTLQGDGHESPLSVLRIRLHEAFGKTRRSAELAPF